MHVSTEVRVATADLKVGCTVQYAINDLQGRMLLSGGVHITRRIKDQFAKRNIDAVLLHPDDFARVNPSDSRAHEAGFAQYLSGANSPDTACVTAFAALAEATSYEVKNEGQAIRTGINPPRATPYDPEQRERLTQQFDAINTLLQSMIEGALDDQELDATDLDSVAMNYMSELVLDGGQAISRYEELGQGPEILPRSIRMASLAMAVAIEMGYDEENVRTVGLAGLVHDWGWFRLENRLRDPHAPRTTNDWRQVVQHPRHSVELLEQVIGITDLTRLVCYQAHELFDGSGYPRGRKGGQIHIFARILGVADTFIALVSQIRGRPALIPYDAMTYLLHQAKRGRFDKEVVRGLLHTLSLFPIGSHLRLKDGSEAKVIRSNGQDFVQPIIQKITGAEETRGSSAHELLVINLAETDGEILEVLPTPDRNEMRLDPELMAEIHWDSPGA